MITVGHPSALFSIGIAALVAWRVYRRVRWMIGRQPLKAGRAWMTLVFFPLAMALLLTASLRAPASLAALLAGGATGAALGVYGLRLTRFEALPTGLFFTPNAYLGIALSVLFVGRIAYRFVKVWLFDLPSTGGVTPGDFIRSPLTLALFGMLAAYYSAYAAGLLAWRRRAQQAGTAIDPSTTA